MELLEYWSEYPPTHILLRAMAQFKPQKRTELNRWEREIMPSPSADLPPAPDYVIAAIQKHKADLANA